MSLRTAAVALLLGLATASPVAAMDLKTALEIARRSSPQNDGGALADGQAYADATPD